MKTIKLTKQTVQEGRALLEAKKAAESAARSAKKGWETWQKVNGIPDATSGAVVKVEGDGEWIITAKERTMPPQPGRVDVFWQW